MTTTLKLSLLSALALASVPSQAATPLKAGKGFSPFAKVQGFDFVAPIVDSESDAPKQAGLIFYDINEGLKVYNPAGGVDLLSSPGNATVTSGTAERIERITFGGGTLSSPTACSSDPCTILTQSGSWVTSVNRSSVGVYVVNFATATFSAPPTCTVASGGGTTYGFQVEFQGSFNTSNLQLIHFDVGSMGAATDGIISLICMGPR